MVARIRTIKPEFPHSESMGKVSRDARLLFVELWTLCDDEGRARGASRMLASLLFPYDDDAPGLIDGWLRELEREGCLRRYVVTENGVASSYLQVLNWGKHQKIDRPSRSKIPPPREHSRGIANTREDSSQDRDLDLDLSERVNEARAREEADPEAEPLTPEGRALDAALRGLGVFTLSPDRRRRLVLALLETAWTPADLDAAALEVGGSAKTRAGRLARLLEDPKRRDELGAELARRAHEGA